MLNGDSLQIITMDKELKSNFKFVLQLMQSVIAYNMSPINKKQLVKMIQDEFLDNPTVMVIGDGLNDVMMMQQANVSIEKVKKYKRIKNTSTSLTKQLQIKYIK